ncbi:MAG: peptidylprolyl isomerase [Sphingomonadales bacterium]|nr:peptidylprolyl isomerase [Sphingomonadaceae bacterium]MBS3930172.1 peptidylprolyl isomerase [Sphingomonadales bacterium]
MKRRFVLSALPAMLLALSGAAKPKPKVKAPPAPPPPPPLGDTVQVELVTELGSIVVELNHKAAPITVKNFMRYVDTGRYDGMVFYRAMHLDWGKQPNGLVQGGLNDFPLKLLPPIAHEPTSVTGLTHKAGTLSMARNAPGTARSDFSILLSDLTSFDADPKSANPEAQLGYAAFGHVVSGMDVVRKIYDSPRSPTKGEGVMKGQMLEPRIKVLKARRIPPL